MIESIITKISNYNIFNYLFSGIIFVILMNYFEDIQLYLDISNTSLHIINLFLIYFIGLTISRVGSLTVEPFYKKCIIKFADYKDFLKVEAIDQKLDTISEQNNVYRTFVSLFLVLVIFHFVRTCELSFCLYIQENYKVVILVSLFLLYSISYYKQIKYIKDRIKYKLPKEEDE